MIKKTSVIIDTDPGIDDAIALAAAFACDRLDIKLISTVSGNVGIENTTNNALKLVEFFNKDIKVSKGASRPLIKECEHAEHIHGESGMDGYDFKSPKRSVYEKNSVEAMREIIQESDEKITLVTIGPLTNVATLFLAYPEVKENIEKIVVMGGSSGRGNVTPAAEFNIYADPEAAKIVFKAGIKIVVCGLDVTSTATLDVPTINELKNMNKAGEMCYSLFKHYRDGSIENGDLQMHDLTTIAYLDNPDLFESKEAFIDIEVDGEYTKGFMIVDFDGKYSKEKNAEFCTKIDVVRFRKWILDLFNNINV